MDLADVFLGWFYWDPPREAFTVPVIDRAIMWYGICFVLGFFIGYFIAIPIFKRTLLRNHLQEAQAKSTSFYLVDRLTWFIIAGTLIGARLGEVFFYDWPYYKNHLLDIVKIWNGGLASHGGALGVLIAIFLFQRIIGKKYPGFSFLELLDMIVIPTALVACFIRIGNFFNQEILGHVTSLPWGIIFGHPADGSSIAPRHPVQLYEAGTYFATFFVLYFLWKYKAEKLPKGFLTGLFFILVFGSRFLIEFLKMPLSQVIDESTLNMGQYLSLPFILAGFFLCFPKCLIITTEALRTVRKTMRKER